MKSVGSLAVGMAFLGVAQVASAQEKGNKMPLNFIDRPLTLPRGVIEGQFNTEMAHVPADPSLASAPAATPGTATEGTNLTQGTATTATATAGRPEQYIWNASIGAAVGLTRDFEIQSTFLPMQLAPSIQYGNPSFQGTYRFARGQFEMGGRMKVTLNTEQLNGLVTTDSQGRKVSLSGFDVASTTLEPGFPLLLRFHHRARIDTGVFPQFTIGGTSTDSTGQQHQTTQVGLNIPVDLSIALTKAIYVGAGTGLRIGDFGSPSNTFAFPLEAFAGFSIGTRRHPIVDIGPYLRWDYFLVPGNSTVTTPNRDGVNIGNAVQNPTLANAPSGSLTPASTNDKFNGGGWVFGINVKSYGHFL